MADQPENRTPLQWTGGYYREPVWPREPDIVAVRSLAKRYLQSQFPTQIEGTSLEISFFAEGLYNKLYKISWSEIGFPSYLLRVAIPVVPYFKTESEVATLAYLRANTSVPVPRVIAWQSNVDNELGFEWLIMEFMEGVPLYDIWRRIPWDRKLELIDSLAGLVKEIQDHKFNSIGALYFKSARGHEAGTQVTVADCSVAVIDAATDKPPKTESAELAEASLSTELQVLQMPISQTCIEYVKRDDETLAHRPCGQPTLSKEHGKDDFAIGPLFDPLFFMENRPNLAGDRGPYPNSVEWLRQMVNIQMEYTKSIPLEDNDEYTFCFEDAPIILSLCNEFLEILPAVFEEEEEGKASYVLNHSDLNLANILVHPETFSITAIVDWEMVDVVPQWLAKDYPEFLCFQEPLDEVEPPIPSYEDEEAVPVYSRDRWDYRMLRRHWDTTMKRLRGDPEASTTVVEGIEEKMRLRRECWEKIPHLTDRWNLAQDWLNKYKLRNRAMGARK